MAPESTLNVSEEWVKSVGGIGVFLRSWQPPGPLRAVVVICHGVNSHGGQYLWAGEHLARAGFAVFALDLRGRGRSEGERFYVSDVADYVGDVTAVIRIAKTRHRGLPLFLLGHSAGGVVSCTYALDNQKELAGLICESFAFRVPAPRVVLSIIKGLSAFAPRLRVLRLKNEDFSRDPAVVAALNSDPLTTGETQPSATVAALVRANERLEKEFPLLTIPVFVLHGTKDRATLPEGSQFFHDTGGSKDKTLKLYDGHYHDLLSDYGKEAVLSDVTAWINARVTT